MKRKTGLLLGLLGILVVTVTVQALVAYNMKRSVIGGGGGLSTGTLYRLRGAIGQPVTGFSDGTNYDVRSGFFPGLLAEEPPGPTPTRTSTPTQTLTPMISPTPTRTTTPVPGLTPRVRIPIIVKNAQLSMLWP